MYGTIGVFVKKPLSLTLKLLSIVGKRMMKPLCGENKGIGTMSRANRQC